MTDDRHAFGARIAELRRQRDLTQDEFASRIGRTASWVSQVERGVQPVNRLDVLRLVADALGVSVQTLRPEAPTTAPAAESGQPERANDLDQARLVISGHPVPEIVLGNQSAKGAVRLGELRTAVDKVWGLTHEDRFAELSAAVGSLVPRLERAVRTAPAKDRPELYLLLSRAYQALSAAFTRQDDAEAAWVAADRAIHNAELCGQPLQVFAGVFRLAHAFVRLKHLDQAEHAATTAVNAVDQYAQRQDVPPEALSVLGSLRLVLALVHARTGDRTKARTELDLARRVAQRLGADRNDFNLEFGPTNVEIQSVSIAVDLGDAGEAIDVGLRLDARALSVERQARLLMDLGRAHAQRRQTGEALACLLQAEELAPEVVHSHVAARQTIRELMLVAGRAASPELKALAGRADARP